MKVTNNTQQNIENNEDVQFVQDDFEVLSSTNAPFSEILSSKLPNNFNGFARCIIFYKPFAEWANFHRTYAKW